ncbi:hypothetical protein ABPG72_002384 [Tetrahymena utriculariae]
MDNIKKRDDNSLKIKIRNKKNQEEVISQLKDQQKLEELQISVKKCEEGRLLLNQISSHFKYLQNLKQLSYSINNLLNLDICFIFKDLSKLTNLSSLSIRLMKEISYQQNPDNINLGQCLSSLTNLKVLKLDLYLFYSSQFQECFQMLEAYQKFKTLKTLQIELRYLPRNYSTMYEIVEGISNLQSLEELVFKLGIHTCGNSGFDKFIEEIYYLVNLKMLALKINDSYYLGRNAQRFLQVIKNLQKLEEITLKLPNQLLKENSFVKELEFLSNLKKINYQSQNLDCYRAEQQIQQIIQFKNLDETKLYLRIMSERMNKDQLQRIQENLLNASNLTKLCLSFPPNSQILLFELMRFLICLQNHQKLEKIEIIFPQANEEEFWKEDSEQHFQIPHNYLKKFKLEIKQTRNKKDCGRLNKLLSIFKSQTQLESFYFQVSDISYADNLGQLDLGDVLSEMDNLKYLILNIGQQYFVQEEQILKIFNDLKRKEKLEKFTIKITRQNQFNNFYFKQLGESLNYLQNLKELDLNIVGNTNDFDSLGIFQFSQGFKQLQQLRSLTLVFNKATLGFPCIYPILLQIKELKKLRHLQIRFRGQQYADTNQEILPEIVFPQELKSISIHLKQGQTELKCIKGIFEGVQSLVNLTILKIQINLKQLELEEIKYIENKLANCTALQSLELDFSQSSLIYLMNMTKRFYQLEDFTFLSQFIHLQFQLIIAQRQIYQNLRNSNYSQQQLIQNGGHFDLLFSYFKQFNQQDSDIFKEIFSNIEIKSLEFEYDIYQKFTDEQAFYLFSNMTLLVNLEFLKLKFKKPPQLSQISFNLIAQTLSTLKNLVVLDLQIKKHNDYYDFANLKPIFNLVSSLQQLEKLSFEFFDFQAEEETLKVMFDSISNLKNLNYLKLYIYESFKLENTQNNIKQMFSNLTSLTKIHFFVNLSQSDSLNAKIFFQNFQKLQKANQIKTFWNLSSLKRILLKIPKLVQISKLNI